MVRAILAGNKTQTRWIVTKRNSVLGSGTWPEDGLTRAFPQRDGSKLMLPGEDDTLHRLWPKWSPGENLWVRETWKPDPAWGCLRMKPSEIPEGTNILYRATLPEDHPKATLGKWHPSIFMPRWASRITLEITAVRVERLQDIRSEDAEDEGCEPAFVYPDDIASACIQFRELWESINGADSWTANPWVWVIEFRRTPIRNPQSELRNSP